MNFDDIQQTWNSPSNRPSAGQMERDKMKLLRDLRNRRRGAVVFMVWIFAVLGFITARAVLHLISPDPSSDPIDLSREWSAILLISLPWVGLLVLYRKYRRHRERNRDSGRSIDASVRALLDENRMSRERHRWASWLSLGMLLLMPLVVYQLRAVGKAGDEILLPAFVLLPVIMLAIFIGMRWHDLRVLKPRREALEALLASYENLKCPGGEASREGP